MRTIFNAIIQFLKTFQSLLNDWINQRVSVAVCECVCACEEIAAISVKRLNGIWPILRLCWTTIVHTFTRTVVAHTNSINWVIELLFVSVVWQYYCSHNTYNEFPVHCALYPLMHLARCHLSSQTILTALFGFEIEQMLHNTRRFRMRIIQFRLSALHKHTQREI